MQLLKISSVLIWTFCILFGCSKELELQGPIPERIEPVGELSYTVEARSSITKQFRVKVLSKNSSPVPNVSVFFRIDQGTATLSDSTIRTDNEGIAMVEVTTGPEVQTIQVLAKVPGLENSSLLFSIEIVPQMPATIVMVSGDQQEAVALNAMVENIQVRIVDAFGNAVANASVNFTITSGNGTIDSQSSQFKTNHEGIAYAKCIAGNLPVNIITASLGNLPPVNFTLYSLIPVTVNKVRSAQHAAIISWTKTINSTFAYYSILRKPVKTNYFTEVGVVNDPDITEFDDENAEIGRAYTYMVRVVTVKNNFVDGNEINGERGELINLKNESDVADVILSSDKSTIYVAKIWSKLVMILSTDSFQKIDSIELQDSPLTLAVNADQTKLYVGLYGLPRFQVIDLATKTVLHDIDVSAEIGADAIGDIYVTGNGLIFASSYGGYVARIDATDNYAVNRVASNEFFTAGSPTFVTDHGNYLYMEESLLSPNSLYKIDMSLENAPIVLEDAHGTIHETRNCALSSDGTLLYLTSGQIVSTNTLKPVGELNSSMFSLQISEQKLYGCFYGNAFERWNLNRVNLSTQVIEKSIPLGFKSQKMFLSADGQSAFLISVPNDPYYTVRIYKVNLSN